MLWRPTAALCWLSTQTPHQDRDGLAGALGLDPGDVRVIGPDVGGGFGAKGLSVEDVLVAWLARKTGRPVRWTETRTENMTAMHHGRAAILDVTLGGSRDGKIGAYDPITGAPLGNLLDKGGSPLSIEGLWGAAPTVAKFVSEMTNDAAIGRSVNARAPRIHGDMKTSPQSDSRRLNVNVINATPS